MKTDITTFVDFFRMSTERMEFTDVLLTDPTNVTTGNAVSFSFPTVPTTDNNSGDYVYTNTVSPSDVVPELEDFLPLGAPRGPFNHFSIYSEEVFNISLPIP